MKTDPKLVEALASWRCTHDTNSWAPCEACIESARIQVRRHRIVQLPEEPDHWQYKHPALGWRESAWGTDHAGTMIQAKDHDADRIRPIYIVPGDPQEVEP